MSPLKQYSCASDPEAHCPYLSSRILFVLAGACLSLPVLAAEGTDVSQDELYSDDVTLTTVNGEPLDINGDGNVDLVVGTNQSDVANASRYYLGNGDGTFQETPVLLDNRATSEAVAADFNGDTFIDLVQGVRDLKSRIFLGNGAGGIGNAIDILDTDRVLAIAVGDLDGDGDLDLVTGTGHRGGEPGTEPLQENRFYLNSTPPAGGAPVFTGSDISADADDTRSIALADMDGDGDLDVIAGNDETTPGSNRVYLNQLELGAGVSFAAGIDFGPPDDQTSKILIGDLNNDGQRDIVVLNFIATGSPGIDRFFLNETTAAGTLQMSAATDISADVTHSSGGALADFDNDGDLDIAVANLTSAGDTARNRLYLNQFIPSGSVTFTGSDISADEHRSRELAAGDIDGDGDIDVVVGNQPVTDVPGRDRVYLNNGTAEPFAGVVNSAPEFTSTPVTDATEGAGYTYNVTATDQDSGATLTITAPTVPAWLTLTDNGDGTATLAGTPAAADVGDHPVSLQVSDGTDTATQDFTITVSGVPAGNNPPAFTSTPVTEAAEDAAYTYEVAASDPDSGASLTITAPTLPGWLTLTDNGDGTASLSGTPAEGDVGEHDVSLEVSDGTDTAAQDFTISVEAAQDPAPSPPPGGGNDDGGGSGATGLGLLLALAACAAARRRRQNG